MTKKTKPLNCSQVDAVLGTYLEGGLPAQRAATVQSHLDTCPACRGTADREILLMRQLQREANWRRRRLSSAAAARVQDGVYGRIKRALIVQHVIHFSGRVAALVALALGVGALVLWSWELIEKEETTGHGVEVGDQDGRIVITFAYPHYLTAFNEADYQRLADVFNAENPDLWVELREISNTELESAHYPELVFDQALRVDVFLSRGFQILLGNKRLLDLDALIALRPEFDRGDFYPLALEALSQDGGLWGVPGEVDLALIYYNQDLFDRAGVPYPTAGWTREDFLETAVALRAGLPERKLAFAGQVDEAVPFIYAHGGALKKRQDYALTFTPTVEAVRWFADLALVYDVMPSPGQLEQYEPEPRPGRTVSLTTPQEDETPEMRWGRIGSRAFMAAQEGDVALWSGSLVDRGGTAGWHWDFEWGVVPWPRDQVEIVVNRTWAYFVLADTPHPKAALRWLDYLTRQLPQLKGIPARRSVAESGVVRQAFVGEIGAEAYDACLRAIERAAPVDYSMYHSAEYYLGQALIDVFENGEDVETALSKAQVAFEKQE